MQRKEILQTYHANLIFSGKYITRTWIFYVMVLCIEYLLNNNRSGKYLQCFSSVVGMVVITGRWCCCLMRVRICGTPITSWWQETGCVHLPFAKCSRHLPPAPPPPLASAPPSPSRWRPSHLIPVPACSGGSPPLLLPPLHIKEYTWNLVDNLDCFPLQVSATSW